MSNNGNYKDLGINSPKELFNLETEVYKSKVKIEQSRALIEENRMMILSNYSSAFTGNRRMALSNTEEVYVNRITILDNMVSNSEPEADYIKIQKEKNRLEYTLHKANINTQTLEVSERMAAVNAELVKINRQIMETNKIIVEFNAAQIEANTKLLEGEKISENVSSEEMKKEINSNKLFIIQIQSIIASLSDKVEKVFSKSSANNENLMKNKDEIYTRRNEILENREAIERNKERIEALMQ